MPDRGLLKAKFGADGAISTAGTTALTLTSARIAQFTFEVEQSESLRYQPCEVSRPIPCYGRVLAVAANEATFALLMVGGRYKLLPRNTLVQGIVQDPHGSLASQVGGPLLSGEVEFRSGAGGHEVTISNQNGPLANLQLPALTPLDPGILRWDPWLVFSRQDDAVNVVEVTPEVSLTSAMLSKAAIFETAASVADDSPWRKLASLNPISTCYAEGTLTLSAPSFAFELPVG